jgi:hypothetical protein
MSTQSIKPFLEQNKKVKFNQEEIIEEISAYENSIEKRSDQLSKIMEEDLKTEYGWSKLNDKQTENKPELKKKILKTNLNEIETDASYTTTTVTTNFLQAISWDNFQMAVDDNEDENDDDKTEFEEPQEPQQNDFTQFIQPLEFNTQKIPHIILTNETANDETFTNIQDKYKIKENNYYRLCADITNTTVDSTKCLVEKSQFIEQQQSQFIEHHQSQYQSQLTFNQSKITIPSNMTITNNLTLPELALPPDFTGLKSFVFNDKNKEPEFELLTRERMEETMTLNFKKCYKVIAEATGGALNMTANPCFNGNTSKLGDFEHATKTLPNIWKYFQEFTVTNPSTDSVELTGSTNFTAFKTTNFLSLNENSNDSERSRSPVNDTIMFATRDPFNYEYKNRLLARYQEVLNDNKGYLCVDMNLPPINVNRVLAFGKFLKFCLSVSAVIFFFLQMVNPIK